MVFSWMVSGINRASFHPLARVDSLCRRDTLGTASANECAGNECPEMSALQNEQSPKLSFTKASACGNDFLLVEASHAPGDLRALTRRLCDRHNGIGADGVEWLFPDAEADIDAASSTPMVRRLKFPATARAV